MRWIHSKAGSHDDLSSFLKIKKNEIKGLGKRIYTDLARMRFSVDYKLSLFLRLVRRGRE